MYILKYFPKLDTYVIFIDFILLGGYIDGSQDLLLVKLQNWGLTVMWRSSDISSSTGPLRPTTWLYSHAWMP